MNEEASRYLRDHITSRIPYIGRQNSLLFVERLYKKGAVSVSISATGISWFIIEMIVTSGHSDATKEILIEIFKTKPYAVTEFSRNCFRINWKIGWQ